MDEDLKVNNDVVNEDVVEETNNIETETSSENIKNQKKDKSFLGKKKQNAEIEKMQKLNDELQVELDEQKDKYASAAAVGSLTILITSRPAILPASFVA